MVSLILYFLQAVTVLLLIALLERADTIAKLLSGGCQ